MDVALSCQWSGLPSLSLIKDSYFWKEMYEFYFYLTGDYGCCSHWSVIRYTQFFFNYLFFNYLFLFFDKSVYCLNFTLQWSPVSKSTICWKFHIAMSLQFQKVAIWERNVWVLFVYLTGDYGCCSQWSVIRYA